MILGGCAAIGIRLWHDDGFISLLMMFVLSSIGLKYIQPGKGVVEDMP